MSYFDTYSPYAAQVAGRYGVPQQLFFDVISAESGWNPQAYNISSGASGIAQFLPSTAANAGYGISAFNPFDAQSSLSGAAQYLSALYRKAGSWTGALNLYSGNTSGGTPYSGNSAIASDLAALGEGGGTVTTGATSGGGTTGSGSSTASTGATGVWNSITTWLGAHASRAALAVLAVLLIAGALLIFGFRTFEGIPLAPSGGKASI